MKKIILERISAILKLKKRLEDELSVKISEKDGAIFFEGDSEDEYIAEKVFYALDMGFPVSNALLIKKQDFEFSVVNIKDYCRSKNLERIRGRIIGRGGKALKTLSHLTNSYFEIKGNKIGIISNYEWIRNAQEAIIMLIQGTKHSNVYSYLERNRPNSFLPQELGLKESKKK